MYEIKELSINLKDICNKLIYNKIIEWGKKLDYQNELER